MTRTHKFLLAAIVSACAAIGYGQASEAFIARLSAVPADARTRAELAGSGYALATLTGSKLTISGAFDGLKSAAVSAKIHDGTMAGVRGPVLQEITVAKNAKGSITGSLNLTPDLLHHLNKGGLYVQIYSEKAPDGVLCGWFMKQ